MKKLFLILITAIVMTGCYTSEDQKQLRDECRNLEAQKSSLTSEISRTLTFTFNSIASGTLLSIL